MRPAFLPDQPLRFGGTEADASSSALRFYDTEPLSDDELEQMLEWSEQQDKLDEARREFKGTAIVCLVVAAWMLWASWAGVFP